MSARPNSRFTTAQAGWIALVVFAAWLVFLFVPTSRKPKPAAPTALPPVVAQSKLESVGLANNPDWQGLPDYFAIWANNVEWVGNKTYFAYWNPGSYSYSYFFEATRGGEGIRFRSLAEKPGDNVLHFDEGILAQYAEERKGDSPSHPFVFPKKPLVLKPQVILSRPQEPVPDMAPIGKVEIKAEPQPIPVPGVNLPEQPNVEPKK